MSTTTDISGLMKFVGRDGWQKHFDDVLEEHFGAAMDALEIEYEEISGLIGEVWMMTLWGCVFEDLLTRTFGAEQGNIVNVYLKRRGWNEKVQDKLYMKALRGSVMSLYEISDVVPGKSMRMRDLIRGGDPILVSEGSATKSLKQWDKLAARVIATGKKYVIAGGLLSFSPEAAAATIDSIRDVIGRRRAAVGIAIDDDTLRTAAPLFSNAWLMDVLPKAMGKDKPTLQNSAGEEVVFHTLRFPLAAGVTHKEIGIRIDRIERLQREGTSFWNWLGGLPPKKPVAATAPNAILWNVTMDDGSVVLGNVELKGRFLALMVNSASRAAEGKAMLEKALGPHIREPLIEIQTVDQMMAARTAREPQETIPLEVATPLVHEMLDKQYRATLDEPVGMLGDMSPRAAIGSAKGRQKVAEWLKYLENRSANQSDPADPMATYDFGWLWRELKIENLRK
jgi:hypothetical protein